MPLVVALLGFALLKLNLVACVGVVRAARYTPAQKVGWLLVVWLVPVVGALGVFRMADQARAERVAEVGRSASRADHGAAEPPAAELP